MPPLTRKSDGLPVGAVAGFCNILWNEISTGKRAGAATHIAVIFDHSSKTFRNEIYPDYKAHRPEPPEDLRPQFPLTRDATRAFSLPCIEEAGFEADDIIASYTQAAVRAGWHVTIVTRISFSDGAGWNSLGDTYVCTDDAVAELGRDGRSC